MKIEDIETVTYFSENADPRFCWISYPKLPNGKVWYVRFMASTEAEASRRARELLYKELERYRKQPKLFPAVRAAAQENMISALKDQEDHG